MVRIALLRGINVGGHTIVRMDALRRLFETLEFARVRTYIASGNVLFDTTVEREATLRARIEKGLLDTFGFPIVVMLRTPAEMRAVTDRHPFDGRLADADWKRYVVFLNDPPAAAAAGALLACRSDLEFLEVRGRDVYAAVHKGHPKPAFSGNWVEKQLKTRGTARNWNTVTRLAAMAAE